MRLPAASSAVIKFGMVKNVLFGNKIERSAAQAIDAGADRIFRLWFFSYSLHGSIDDR